MSGHGEHFAQVIDDNDMLWRYDCLTEEIAMPRCQECEEQVDEVQKVKVDGKVRKVCEECAERLREEAEIAEQSESVVQEMMGFKGRR